ncbi:Peptidyl-prolyl cis-trans isomerase B [Phycisphaerae bacterium RAS1]|nr:Peptidyl-prolyl cis-trans isomerase B [Phycisphaerae bacterium RAS1]
MPGFSARRSVGTLLVAIALAAVAPAQENRPAPPDSPPPAEATPASTAPAPTVPAGAPASNQPPASATQPAPPVSQPIATQPEIEGNRPRVAFEITVGDDAWGTFIIELYESKAPETVRNFLRYVDDGYYNGTIFHRIDPEFLIQGGGYSAVEQPKTDGVHEPIQNEAKNGLKNSTRTVAMARTRQPHSATTQFFINVVDNDRLDYPSFDNWGYCVFGKVVEGWDVIERMKSIETRRNPQMPGERTQPVTPPTIRLARRAAALN